MHKDAIASVRFPGGVHGAWIAWFALIIELAIGGMLLVGLYTQWAAILAALSSLKALSFHRFWPEEGRAVFPISSGTAFLLFVISLSLLVTGAGAHAFDIPL